jgi:hypothetical protein
MNRIDTATPGPAGAKADKTGAETAGARKDGGAAKDAFRALLRRLATGEPATPDRGAATDATPAKPGRLPVPPRAAPAKTAPAAADASDTPADATATPDPTALAAPTPAETATPSAIAWPDFLTSPAPTPAASNDAEPPGRLDVLLRAVSGVLPDAKTGPALPTSSVDIGIARPDQPDATAAATPARSEPTPRDATALLHAALRRDAADGETAPPERDAAVPKMSVLTRETHFEPVQRLSPTQQVVTTVLDEVGPADVVDTKPAATTTDLPQASSRGPLRVLHIKLEPEDLGAVVLRMRLVGQSLELHVEAARVETAHLLDKDRDALVRGLRASGYSPDVVTVQTATVADSAPSQAARSGGGDAGGGAAAFQQPSRDGRPGEGRHPVPHSPSPPERAHDDVDPGRAGGDLYV